jgi:cytochrome c556
MNEKASSFPDDFAAALKEGAQRITTLEELIVAGASDTDTKKLSDLFKLIQTSCKNCHAQYRD